MAVSKFNSVGGYTVGIPPTDIIDETGNITAKNITSLGDIVARDTITAPVFIGDLIGNVLGAVTTLAAASFSSAPPTVASSGMLWLDTNTNVLKVYHPSSGIWEPVVPIVNNNFRYSFSESATWLVVHNRNTTRFSVSLIDSDGDLFYAKINIIDNNSFEVTLTSATSGVVDVTFT